MYYFQAVDRDVHLTALRYVNQPKSAGLAGMVGVYLDMRGRLTKKVYPPLFVQEAMFEVVGIVPHPSEVQAASRKAAGGADSLCDYLLGETF